MKKILFAFILLFWICQNNNLFANSLTSEFQYFNKDSEIVFHWNYVLPLSKQMQFMFLRDDVLQKNETYDRENRWNKTYWKIVREDAFLKAFYIRYENASDTGKISNDSYNITKRMKSAFVDFSFLETAKLQLTSSIGYLHHRERNLEKQDTFLLSNGIHNIAEVQYNNDAEKLPFHILLSFDKKDLDYDWHKILKLNATNKILLTDIKLSNKLSVENAKEEIYEQQTFSEDFTRKSVQLRTFLDAKLYSKYHFKLTNSYRQKNHHFEQNKIKNYIDNTNDLYANLNQNLNSFSYQIGYGFDFQNKNYEIELQSLDRLRNHLDYEIKYTYSENDTLGFRYDTELTQYFYNDESSIYDQDIWTETNQFFFISKLNRNIEMTTFFTISNREESFINASLSSSNRTKTRYQLQPSVRMDWKNLSFEQSYILQAVYDEYKYVESGADQLFRKLTATYALAYPIFSYYDWQCDGALFYQHETADYGRFEDEIYYRKNINKLNTYECEVKFYDDRFSCRLRPRFYYEEVLEYSPIMEVNYSHENSIVRILLNPAGQTRTDTIWKISGEIEIVF